MIIAGIGARGTPEKYCQMFEEFGAYAMSQGWWIRSGHADGADYAFEKGALKNTIVYLPYKSFNKKLPMLGRPHAEKELRDDAMKIVFYHQEYARKLDRGVQMIKQRNVFQVLGTDLDTPSDIVVCWTIDGKVTGGTGLALEIARVHGIPIINLGAEPEMDIDTLIEAVHWEAETLESSYGRFDYGEGEAATQPG